MDEGVLKQQLSFYPDLKGSPPSGFDNIIIGGVGGSSLPGRALSFLRPELSISIHNSYGLPESIKDKTLFVAVSYSGNTAETLSFAEEILSKGLPLTVITSGGKLKSVAEENGIPMVLVPEGFKPRNALFFMLRALCVFLNEDKTLSLIEELSVDFEKLKEYGKEISEEIYGKVPLVYSSFKNGALGYIVKILLNETAKIPSFANVFPELSHNELQGLDPLGKTDNLTKNLHVFLLEDEEDDSRIRKQMNVFKETASSKNISVTSIDLPDKKEMKLLYVWILASNITYSLAERYEVDPDETPLMDMFKESL